MIKRLNLTYTVVILCSIVYLTGCQKYLDAKSDKSLVTPSGLSDLQSILDYYLKINQTDPGAGLLSSDDYYLTQTDYDGIGNNYGKNIYTWNEQDLFPSGTNDWSRTFDNVYRANVVLDNISNIPTNAQNASQWNNVKGQALFLRTKAFFQALVIWTKNYDSTTAKNELGIPLRLNSDFDEVSKRSTLEDSYQRIILDCKEASALLPDISVHPLRGSKCAALGLLAKIYLSMGQFDSSFKYADECLNIKSSLMDYNGISTSVTYPMDKYNEEIIYASQISTAFSASNKQVDSLLYSYYDYNDLRKNLFYKSKGNGTYSFKGNYTKSISSFSGIATDDIYLIRSECNARLGKLEKSVEDLNKLLSKRWKTGTFVPYKNLSKESLLAVVLLERRKELAFRDSRWMDLKRLNKDGAGITLERHVNGRSYLLHPNDPRYAIAIPVDVINLSGMEQNPR
ncbi:MAG: hypothetical protein DI598_18260 [Pseudopedobacter saltans]|uniref:RagB/SusD family nutrient uptake outer membrane protein n=1 Tax=Pseudopedobacter saltans TaxID=151895 RepID=A0A2W5EJJ6_9SPHI|nr:MAG: hypothetical protein DI598_18260 [Pseudopedobacter saltans]